MIRRGICSTNKGYDYELASHFDEGSCSEDEVYQLLSKIEEEKSTTLDLEYDYGTPTTLGPSPEIDLETPIPIVL